MFQLSHLKRILFSNVVNLNGCLKITSFSNHLTLPLYLGFKFLDCLRFFIRRASNKVLAKFQFSKLFDMILHEYTRGAFYIWLKAYVLQVKKWKKCVWYVTSVSIGFEFHHFLFVFVICSFCWLCDSSCGQSCPALPVIFCCVAVCNIEYRREWTSCTFKFLSVTFYTWDEKLYNRYPTSSHLLIFEFVSNFLALIRTHPNVY